MDSSKLRTNVDALPPKPNTNANGSPLSYSAQVAEQFSSSYRQTPSQERGRLDAARLAQFNSMSASSTDGQSRPVRPSEMKDEGCVFHRSSIPYPSLLYVKGGVCAPRVAPVVHIYRSTVRQLLSGSVHAYESPPATCVYQMLWRASMASRLTCTVFFHLLLIPYLATKDVKLTCVLCYVALLCLRLRLSSALHLLHHCRLPLFGYYPPNILYSKMFVGGLSWDTTDGTFFPPYITSHSLPLLQCHVHFANLC